MSRSLLGDGLVSQRSAGELLHFKLFLKDKHGYNIAFIVVDQLNKQAISLPCFKTMTIKDIAYIYIDNIYQIHGAPKLIISNCGL